MNEKVEIVSCWNDAKKKILINTYGDRTKKKLIIRHLVILAIYENRRINK